MIITQWPENVNQKFYAFSSEPKDNVKLTEFKSGRTIGYQLNTKKIMIYNCSVRLSKNELNLFWNWFNDILGQCAGSFTCPALGEKFYRFVSVPKPQDTELQNRVLSLEIEEVF